MASVEQAIDNVLRWEDSTLSGVITEDAGGKTRFGVAERYHPELSASLFYGSLGRDAALKIATNIYETQYCEPLAIVDMANQDIANKVLSLGVNLGIDRVSKMLQDVLKVPVDGRIGPVTLVYLSQAEPLDVLAGLRAEAERFYVQIASADPSKEQYLNGWLARARA